MKVTITHGKKKSSKIVIHSADLWDGDHTLALVIYPFLKKYRKQYDTPKLMRSYPASFVKDYMQPDEEKEMQEWISVIDKMIFSFECIAKKRNYVNGFNVTKYEQQEEHEDKIQEGLDLFGKYFRCFWT